MSNAADTTAEILLSIGAVSFSPRKPFRWVSGILSPVYTDNRLLMSFPQERKTVMELLAQKIRGLEFEVVAGIASAGIPFASWLSDLTKKPMVFIRKEAKDHGRGKQIEGVLKPGQKVLLVEDLVSTGRSSLEGVQVLREAGAVVQDCVCIFSYDTKTSRAAFENAQVQLHSITHIRNLLHLSEKKGMIAPAEKETILDFLQNPAEWAGKRGFA